MADDKKAKDDGRTSIAEDETMLGDFEGLDPSELELDVTADGPAADDAARTGVGGSQTRRERPSKARNQTAQLEGSTLGESGLATGGIDPESVPDPLPAGTVIDDHYEIVDHLGAGGMGAVYRARDTRLGRLTAIKAMTLIPDVDVSEQLRVFKRDAVATAQLRHPNVVTIFDYGVHGETPYIVLELLEGKPLDHYLAEFGALPVERALGITAQILAALAHAHDAGVLHRDLKPANVFLVDDGPVKVLDFGMADLDVSRSQLKEVLGKKTQALKIEFGDAPVGGSPAYMAPEQWRDDTQSAATDMWAVGVLLHEMTTGKLPFEWQGMRQSSWGLKPAPEIPKVVSSAPEDVRELIEALLAWSPDQRVADARDAARRVEEITERVHRRLRQPTRIEKGAVIDDRFELVDRIGAGGFGVVFEARQTSTEQIVAIKMLHGAPAHADDAERQVVVDRFKREMTLIAKLRHPNIVRLIDYGEMADHQAYIVLEFIEGTPLSKLLTEEGQLSHEETRHLMGQVLDALAAAHEQGVVHRDLKPDNIIVTRAGGRRNAMVLDFGIASIIGEESSAYQKLTRTNEVVGTPSYMAPEQLLGHGVTERSDIYAWGLVALECLTGETVVHAESGAAVIFQHLSGEPVPIDQEVLATPLGQLLKRTVDKDPDRRFPNAKDLLSALQALDLDAEVELPEPSIHEQQTGALDPVDASEQALTTEMAPPTERIEPSSNVETEALDPIEERSNTALLVAIIVLTLAIGAGVAFIVMSAGDSDSSDEESGGAEGGGGPAHAQGGTAATGEPGPVDSDVAAATSPSPTTAPVADPDAAVAEPATADLPTVDVPAASVNLGLPADVVAELADTFPDFEFDSEFAILPREPFARPALAVMPEPVSWDQWQAGAGEIDACGGPRPRRPANLTDAGAPVTHVGAAEAEAFCAANGMRLPTVEEWEALAVGTTGRRYAVGDAIAADRASALAAAPWPTPEWNVTPEGVRELTAGVAEWVTCAEGRPTYCKDGYASRGGSWQSDPVTWLSAFTARPPEGTSPECARQEDTGFRCVKDVP